MRRLRELIVALAASVAVLAGPTSAAGQVQTYTPPTPDGGLSQPVQITLIVAGTLGTVLLTWILVANAPDGDTARLEPEAPPVYVGVGPNGGEDGGMSVGLGARF